MIDIIMIALEFAPVQTTGAFRSIEFARRLPELGVRPTVVTVDPVQGASIHGAPINHSLSHGLSEGVQVHYIKTDRLLSDETAFGRYWRLLTSFNDTFAQRFSKDFLRLLRDLKATNDYASVFATAPPFGATELGRMASEFLGVPLILDMRDAWAEWIPAPQTTRLHYRRRQRDEARMFSVADAIAGVTPDLVDLFSSSHPTIDRNKFHVIPNGAENLDAIPSGIEWIVPRDDINIGYVGSFYYLPRTYGSLRSPQRFLQYDPGTEDWSYRSPKYFFRAWAELDDNVPEVGARFKFHHVGKTPDWLPAMAAEFGVADRCKFLGQMQRHDVPRFLDSMTGLLATSMKRIGGRDYCLASKSFEYLSSAKPTLAFVCEGAQKDFFRAAGGAIIVDPDDPEAWRVLWDLARRDISLPVQGSYLRGYDLDRTAAQMANLIKATVTPAKQGASIGAA